MAVGALRADVGVNKEDEAAAFLFSLTFASCLCLTTLSPPFFLLLC